MPLTDSEYQRVVSLMGREPNEIELGMFEVMWSEHCSYKNSRPLLKMLPTESDRVIQGPGENAGVVRLEEGYALAFKIESHNHPSAVEPYQGALTGVGGIIRDVISMGARPVALLNSLRFGPLGKGKKEDVLTEEETRARFLFGGVVSGIGGYGNCTGIPTVGGEVYFDESYRGNPLVNAMCVGLLKEDELYRGRVGEPGNILLLVGAKTGRDGILGASFASQALSDDQVEDRPSVQVGDPFMGKLLIESCLELLSMPGVVGVQDLGAGGLVSAASEMASKSGAGVAIDVANVPVREKHMTPYEIMLSESQERMLFAVEEERVGAFTEKVSNWGLEATNIGVVTEGVHLEVYQHEKRVADIHPLALTDNAPEYRREGKFPAYLTKAWAEAPRLEERLKEVLNKTGQDTRDIVLNVLSSPNIAEKKWIFEQFDHTVGTNTIVPPGCGAGVIRIKGTDMGVSLTCDGNSRFVFLDPERGGKIAVAEAARNLAVQGAAPLGITNCLNFGNPENPETYYQLEQAITGMKEGAETLSIPVTGGNVSLYNEGVYGEIKPTPVIGMVGLLKEVSKRCTPAYKEMGDQVILLGETRPEFGGSEVVWQMLGETTGRTPEIDLRKEKALQTLLLKGIQENMIKSAVDLSEGGLAAALTKCTLASGLGAEITFSQGLSLLTWLLSESQSRALITLSEQDLKQFMHLAAKEDVSVHVLGVVKDGPLNVQLGKDQALTFPLEELQALWKEAIPCVMD